MGTAGCDHRPTGSTAGLTSSILRHESFLRSFDLRVRGIAYAVRTQRNARVHLLISGLVVLAAVYFG